MSQCDCTATRAVLRGKYFHVAQHAPGSWLCYGGVSCLGLRVGQDLISHTAQLKREDAVPAPAAAPGDVTTKLHLPPYCSQAGGDITGDVGRGVKQAPNPPWLLSYFPGDSYFTVAIVE